MLQTAIKLFLENRPDCNVTFKFIWSSGGFYMPDGRWIEPDRQLENTGKVIFFQTLVLRAQYLELLGSTDWVVLPYRVSPYQRRSSLVAVDAVCRGIPGIYTKGTNQEEMFNQYGAGIGVSDADPNDLADAIYNAYLKNEGYQFKAREKAVMAREAFSPEAFWNTIWPGFCKSK